jgi:hypothetical protein
MISGSFAATSSDKSNGEFAPVVIQNHNQFPLLISLESNPTTG